MNCPHFSEPFQCAVISQISGISPITKLTQGACDFCTKSAVPPQSLNEVTVSLACGQFGKENPDGLKRVLATHGHLLRKEFPPWAKQAWSAATAVADWVSQGAPGIPQPDYEARLRTCDTCPNRELHRCRLCGCYVRGKASLSTESCPIGLWGAIP